MRFYFSWKVTVTCLALAVGMCRLSYWQYTKYRDKEGYIATMASRLTLPPVPLTDLLNAGTPDPSEIIYRRVEVTGSFDFKHEMVLRNRRLGELSGVFAITPLALEETGASPYLLVSRGFIPLAKAEREQRSEFHHPVRLSFTGLVKESSSRRFLAPADPPSGLDLPWVDAWLRIDIPRMQSQLPYPVLPFYVEIMETPDSKGVEEKILESKKGREELFFLGESRPLSGVNEVPDLPYPVPVYDSVIPPGRHFGYIFEWLILAFLTLCAGVILQLRPPRPSINVTAHTQPVE